MKFFIFYLYLLNIIIEFCYVKAKVSEECLIFNKINGITNNSDCCSKLCRGNNPEYVCDNEGHVHCM